MEKKTVEIKICKWYKIVEVTGSGTLKLSLFKEDKRGKDDGEEIEIFVNNGWRELSKTGGFRCFFFLFEIFFRHLLLCIWMSFLSWRTLQSDWTYGGKGDRQESGIIIQFNPIFYSPDRIGQTAQKEEMGKSDKLSPTSQGVCQDEGVFTYLIDIKKLSPFHFFSRAWFPWRFGY